MGLGALRIWRLAIAASVAASLVTAVAATPSHAGTLWVADGNMSAGPGQSGSCDAFGVGGDLSVASVPSSCPMSLQVNGDMPQWQLASWSTTAPPGITINTAFTTNGDVSSGGIADGFVAEDFWYTGGAWHGSTLAPGQEWFNTGLEGSADIDSQVYGFQIACTENLLDGGCYPPWPTLPVLSVSGIELEGTENSAPSVAGRGVAVDEWIVGVESAGRLMASDVCMQATSLGSAARKPPSRNAQTERSRQNRATPLSGSSALTPSAGPSASTRARKCLLTGSFDIDLSATNAAGVESTVPQERVGGQRSGRRVVPQSERPESGRVGQPRGHRGCDTHRWPFGRRRNDLQR